MTDDTPHHPAADRPLTTRSDTSLRSNCISDGTAVSWQACSDRYELWSEHASNANALVDEWDTTSLLPYHEGFDRLLMDQLEDLRAGLRKEHRALYTHVLTLTGEAYEGDEWACPVDYYRDLTASWEQVRKALYNALSDTEWQYARILDVSEDSYPVIRAIVFTADSVDADDLYDSAVQGHIDNSSVASEELHVPDRCIRQGRSLGISEFVENNLSCFGDNRNGEWREKAFTSLLWVMDEDRFSFSQGAYDYVDRIDTDASPSMSTTE